jgi:hypothetical protein
VIRENKDLIEDCLDNDDLLKQRLGIVTHLKQVQNYHDRAAHDPNEITIKAEK